MRLGLLFFLWWELSKWYDVVCIRWVLPCIEQLVQSYSKRPLDRKHEEDDTVYWFCGDLCEKILQEPRKSSMVFIKVNIVTRSSGCGTLLCGWPSWWITFASFAVIIVPTFARRRFFCLFFLVFGAWNVLAHWHPVLLFFWMHKSDALKWGGWVRRMCCTWRLCCSWSATWGPSLVSLRWISRQIVWFLNFCSELGGPFIFYQLLFGKDVNPSWHILGFIYFKSLTSIVLSPEHRQRWRLQHLLPQVIALTCVNLAAKFWQRHGIFESRMHRLSCNAPGLWELSCLNSFHDLSMMPWKSLNWLIHPPQLVACIKSNWEFADE